MQSLAPPRGVGAVSSPWAQIFRGEPSSATAVIEQLVVSDDGGAGAVNRLAWNAPANGAEVESVMGADSWPALSESAKGLAKATTECFKSVDGSSVFDSFTEKQGSPLNMVPSRQKRNGDGSASINGGLSQLPGSPAPLVDMSLTNQSPKVISQRSGYGNNYPPRNSLRSRNGGSHPRGDGYHNYGVRRDQDGDNQDWNAHQHISGRDGHVHQHRVAPRFVVPPPPPSSVAFMPPSSVRRFGSPIGFPELATPVYFIAPPPPESLRGGVPFMAPIPPHAVFSHAQVLEMHGKIVNQIDYYFSNENLVKDTYLRQNMDELGWVPIKLLASFKQVKLLTENTQLIADAVQASTLVEVRGDKVRRRNDWMKWIIPPTFQFSNRINPQPTMASNPDTLATGVQGLNLEKATHNSRGHADSHASPLLGMSKSRVSSSHSSAEETGESSVPSRN